MTCVLKPIAHFSSRRLWNGRVRRIEPSPYGTRCQICPRYATEQGMIPFRMVVTRDLIFRKWWVKTRWWKPSTSWKRNLEGSPLSCLFHHNLFCLNYCQMRGTNESSVLHDHIVKEMNPLVETRIKHIPLQPGSDWRDLPNMSIKLSNGTYCNKL